MDNNNMKYYNSYVAFLDVLGFKNLVLENKRGYMNKLNRYFDTLNEVITYEFLTIKTNINKRFNGRANTTYIRCSNCGSDYHYRANKPFVRVKMTIDEYNTIKTKFL